MLQIIVTNPNIERTTVKLHDLNVNAWHRIIAVKTMLDDTTRVGIIVKAIHQENYSEYEKYHIFFSGDAGPQLYSRDWKTLIEKNQLDGLKFYFV
jgi:hypothetical protein